MPGMAVVEAASVVVELKHSSKVGWLGPTISSQSLFPESNNWHSLVSKLCTKYEQKADKRLQASWQTEWDGMLSRNPTMFPS
jgi:hypothetical protein